MTQVPRCSYKAWLLLLVDWQEEVLQVLVVSPGDWQQVVELQVSELEHCPVLAVLLLRPAVHQVLHGLILLVLELELGTGSGSELVLEL